MKLTDEEIAILRHALVRLLWGSVAEHAQCTCRPDDMCPLCQAMRALGFAKWVDWTDTKKCLATEPT